MPCCSFLLNPERKLQENITLESTPSLKYNCKPTALLCSCICHGDGQADLCGLCQQWDEFGLSTQIPAPKRPEGLGAQEGARSAARELRMGLSYGCTASCDAGSCWAARSLFPPIIMHRFCIPLFSPPLPPARPQPCVLMRAANFTSVLCSR